MNHMYERKLCLNNSCISALITEVINKTDNNNLFVIGEVSDFLKDLYTTINIIYQSDAVTHRRNAVYFVSLDKDNTDYINHLDSECIYIIYDRNNLLQKITDIIRCPYMKCSLDLYSELNGSLYLAGNILGYDYNNDFVPHDSFKVLAIMHTYNEQDIIEESVEYIMSQNLYLHVLDNWSTDDTYKKLEKLKKKYPDKITLQRYPDHGGSEDYEWYNQLKKTEEIAKNSDFDWFIHYDADEIRISPWENVTLSDAIFKIDSLGYNIIDNNVIDFRMTEHNDENIFGKGEYFEFRYAENLYIQRKTWKKTLDLDIKTSGGHVALVNNPKVFPLRILNKHYPLRSIEQAQKKVFNDRIPRMKKERKIRGWHGHYDVYAEGKDFIFDLNNLWKWENNTFFDMYLQLFMGIGICFESFNDIYNNSQKYHSKRIAIYGAGKIGKMVVGRLIHDNNNNIVTWVDKAYYMKEREYCINIEAPDMLLQTEYDVLIVAIKSKQMFNEILKDINSMGVRKDIICWISE